MAVKVKKTDYEARFKWVKTDIHTWIDVACLHAQYFLGVKIDQLEKKYPFK